MGLTLAIAGATGNVGREILNVLHERRFEADSVIALASKDSEGEDVEFGPAKTLKVKLLEGFDFSGTDIAFFAAGSEISKVYVPKAAAAGAIVIDNSALYRLDPDVPLIVPEVNADSLGGYKKKNIIANPNCSTIQLVVALKPLHDAARAKRVVVATYQSVSGVGREAMDELFHQTRSVFVSDMTKPGVFERQIAFNVIPKIGDCNAVGEALEETKMVKETAKILDPAIKLTATCVRVPVFIGHSEAVNVEFEKPITPEEAKAILRQAPGVMLDEGADGHGFTTPVECIGQAATYVGRVRRDPTVPNGLNFWVVSDNLRKGAALNAVQIAEILVNKHFQGA
ncbi:MAG TPA: aspartate-semialdehyde dehydrogenase [Sphingomonadales bacterium]|nr:aspartate-semialdehyde dehydrogenase [Sphingomonadales bacterium]